MKSQEITSKVAKEWCVVRNSASVAARFIAMDKVKDEQSSLNIAPRITGYVVNRTQNRKVLNLKIFVGQEGFVSVPYAQL